MVTSKIHFSPQSIFTKHSQEHSLSFSPDFFNRLFFSQSDVVLHSIFPNVEKSRVQDKECSLEWLVNTNPSKCKLLIIPYQKCISWYTNFDSKFFIKQSQNLVIPGNNAFVNIVGNDENEVNHYFIIQLMEYLSNNTYNIYLWYRSRTDFFYHEMIHHGYF